MNVQGMARRLLLHFATLLLFVACVFTVKFRSINWRSNFFQLVENVTFKFIVEKVFTSYLASTLNPSNNYQSTKQPSFILGMHTSPYLHCRYFLGCDITPGIHNCEFCLTHTSTCGWVGECGSVGEQQQQQRWSSKQLHSMLSHGDIRQDDMGTKGKERSLYQVHVHANALSSHVFMTNMISVTPAF